MTCVRKAIFSVSLIRDPEVREEGGTPAIVETIRAGMVMQLKDSVGPEYILAREEKYLNMAKEKLANISNLEILGSMDVPRLPVLSFLIKNPGKCLLCNENCTY